MPDPHEHTLCILGMGYIGLPTATILATRGYRVLGVDTDPAVVESINAGRTHFIEPDLDILVQAAVQTGTLKASAQPTAAEVFILCVPTPVTQQRGPDLSYIENATAQIAPHLKSGDLVVLESTSPPGTTEQIAKHVEQLTGLTSEQVHFAHAPERVLPGRILREVVENDRIIGGINGASTDAAAAFYKTFVTGELLLCSSRMAEMAKLVENASRDVQIAFANELSMVCDTLGLDARTLIDLANRHPRVNVLQPGCGVGGHCIAVDPWFIVHQCPDQTPLIQAARAVNDAKPRHVVEQVKHAAARFREPKIALLGLAYKPDIDDLRESPALWIARELSRQEAGELLIVEPNLDAVDGLVLCDFETAVAQADIVVFLVAHRPFKQVAPETLAAKVVIDTCGVTHRR
ncbi:MAG: UDP-N-acetyl-D-mannosamine dehydrogenase [Phycisphaerales bacterium JB063]